MPKRKWPAFLLIGFAVIIVGFFFESAYADKFYPGVSVGGMSVGGKTLAEVTSHFQDEAKILTDNGLRIRLLDDGTTKDIHIPMSAQGLTPDKSFEYFSLGDWQGTVQEAYEFGHSGSLFKRFKDQVSLVLGRKFSFPATLYEVAIDSFISREMEAFLKKTEPAQFVLDKKGKVSITPEKIGEKIDKEKIIATLQKKISSFDSSSENFKAETDIPKSTKDKLEPFLDFAQQLSDKTSLFFHYNGYQWKVSGSKLATWLSINKENNISIDTEKLQLFLSKTVALVINDPPQNSRFEIKDGKLKEITVGKSGSVVDIDKTVQKVEKIIPDIQKSFIASGNVATALAALNSEAEREINFNVKTGVIDIPIEVIQQEPKVTQQTVDQYGITDLVGFSRTSFKGSSADRVKNITIGASKLNGLFIAPGEEFSAVTGIGEVTEADGYTKEYVIKDNRSIKELGGGLCQIATTLFRLGLNAGLPITERQEHRYVVSYYGPGLDATIYGPHPDLKFVNDTGHYLLLQGRVEGTDLILELYGQKDGRQVTISEPVLSNRIPAPPTRYIYTADLAPGVETCSETPRVGMTSDVTYQVAFTSGEVREQNFHSVYQPWSRICLVGIRR